MLAAARIKKPSVSILHGYQCLRAFTSINETLNRSYLYVPATTNRMLQKSLQTKSDIIVYDLEDSVPPASEDKDRARERLVTFLSNTESLPSPERLAVRLNSVNTPHFHHDIRQAMKIPAIRTFVLPKIDTLAQLDEVSNEISSAYKMFPALFKAGYGPLQLVVSIESAKSLWNLNELCNWESKYGEESGGRLDALLFAAEDFCANTGVLRSNSRRELLYARSKIVTAAVAFGLKSIDMVCVNYKDTELLEEECEDGRQLGFNGKQAIHPSQVEIINSTFVPTAKEIERSARIVHAMEHAHRSHRGAIGLTSAGKDEMIDAPMIKQAERVMTIAKRAGLEIPTINS